MNNWFKFCLIGIWEQCKDRHRDADKGGVAWGELENFPEYTDWWYLETCGWLIIDKIYMHVGKFFNL